MLNAKDACELGFCGNLSPPGAGKTVMAAQTARQISEAQGKSIPTLVIGLPQVSGMEKIWLDALRRQGVASAGYLSYDKLRGTSDVSLKNKKCKRGVWYPSKVSHRFLKRFDMIDADEKKKTIHTRYEPSAHLLKVIKTTGIHIIGDELQKVKNDSIQKKAFVALVDATRGDELPMSPGVNGSSMQFLSGSILNDRYQAANIVAALGFKAQEGFIDTCAKLDPDLYGFIRSSTIDSYNNYVTINKTTGQIERTPKNVLPRDLMTAKLKSPQDRHTWYIYSLFVGIMCKRACHAVSVPFDDDPDVRLDFRSVIYPVANETEYNEAVQDLLTAHEKRDKTAIQRCMNTLEELKQSNFADRTVEILKETPNAKIIIILHRTGTIKWTAEKLESMGYKVGVIRGGVSGSKRERILLDFQSPTNRLQIMIAQSQSIATGMTCHDVTGLWPRFTLISPGPITLTFQGMYRTKRFGVKGKITVEIMFGGTGEQTARQVEEGKIKQAPSERKVLARIHAQDPFMKSVAQQQVKDGMLMPSDLPVWRKMPDGSMVLDDLDLTAELNFNPDTDDDEDVSEGGSDVEEVIRKRKRGSDGEGRRKRRKRSDDSDDDSSEEEEEDEDGEEEDNSEEEEEDVSSDDEVQTVRPTKKRKEVSHVTIDSDGDDVAHVDKKPKAEPKPRVNLLELFQPWTVVQIRSKGQMIPGVVADSEHILIRASNKSAIKRIRVDDANAVREVTRAETFLDPEKWAWTKEGSADLGSESTPSIQPLAKGDRVWLESEPGTFERCMVLANEGATCRLGVIRHAQRVRISGSSKLLGRATNADTEKNGILWAALGLAQFEAKPKPAPPPPPPKPQPPLEISFYDLDEPTTACFQLQFPQGTREMRDGVRKLHGPLPPDVRNGFTLDGRVYRTVAHYLYASWWPAGSKAHEEIRTTESLEVAASMAPNMCFYDPIDPREQLVPQRLAALRIALRERFTQAKYLCDALLKTGNRELRFIGSTTPHNEEWKFDGLPWTYNPMARNGEQHNLLGRELSFIRQKLRK